MDILEGCKSLNDVCRKVYGKANYTNREKVKRLLVENGIDWQQWIDGIKNNIPKVFCKHCGKEIPNGYKKRKQFCNSSCAAKYNNCGRVMSVETRNKISRKMTKPETLFAIETEQKSKNNIKDVIVNHCLYCGKEIDYKRTYCSNKCCTSHMRLKVIERWKSGEYDGISGEYSLSKSIRAYLLEKHEYKCEICGWGDVNPYTGTIPLEIHHKDGDYTNNKEENLQVLCPNCHSLTETHKSHNKNGRKGRKKYSQ